MRIAGSSPQLIPVAPTRATSPGGAAPRPTPLPPSAASSPQSWPEPARRALAARAKVLGLSFEAACDLRQLLAAEVKRARAAGYDVTLAEMMAASVRARAASQLQPTGRVLTGFSRLTDKKLELDGAAFAALARDTVSRTSDAGFILGALEAAPSQGRPRTRAELVAALVRHVVTKDGESLQLQVSREDGAWLEKIVLDSGGAVRTAMGGAGGFQANLGAAAWPGVHVTFRSPDPLTPGLADSFGARVMFLDDAGERVERAAVTSEDGVGRVNYIAEFRAGTSFDVLGRQSVTVDGAPYATTVRANGRVILGTPAQETVGFGAMSDEALRTAARSNDVALFAGLHYYTVGDPKQVEAASNELARQLRVMKDAAPRLCVHHQYVVPKVPANEPILLAALRGSVDSLSLNNVEVPQLLARLAQAGLTTFADTPTVREDMEAPAYALDAARALSSALQLDRVHLHGMHGDTLVFRREVDPEKVVLAAMRARQLAVMKTANPSGQIADPREVWPVMPIVEGPCLGEVRSFAEAVGERFDLDDEARARVRRDWYYRDAETGETVVFVPSHGIDDFTGGTVSLGDTIDFGALVAWLLSEQERPRPVRMPPHPSQLA